MSLSKPKHCNESTKRGGKEKEGKIYIIYNGWIFAQFNLSKSRTKH